MIDYLVLEPRGLSLFAGHVIIILIREGGYNMDLPDMDRILRVTQLVYATILIFSYNGRPAAALLSSSFFYALSQF